MDQPISEGFGNVPNASASFGNLPQASEPFRTVPNSSEGFRTFRNVAGKTDQHTVSVRDAARAFEQAGVPRTERSIVNWCQPNRQGIARLDAFFDTNERRYFISEQSIHLAIKEEQAKASANGQSSTPPEQKEQEIPKSSERETKRAERNDDVESDELRRQNFDLMVATRAKDHYIERLEKERDNFSNERQQYIGQLMSFSRQVGELENQLLQIGGPSSEGNKALPTGSEDITETFTI